jgi:membrane protease YdiL (CAAX protease family)
VNAPESPATGQPLNRGDGQAARAAVPPVLAPPVISAALGGGDGQGPGAKGALNRSRWRVHLMLMAAYPVVLGVGAWAGRFDHSSGPALSHGARGLLAVSAFELGVFGTVFGLAWLASRASLNDLRLRWRGGLLTVPIGIGYSVALRVVILILAVIAAVIALATGLITPDSLQHFALANRPDVETLVDVSALRHNPAYYWLTLTLVSFVVAGLREELWRSACLAGMGKLWPRWFGSRAGQLGATGVAAVLFGLGHLPQGPIAVCMTALLGLGLGAIMVFHRSIWPAVIAHGMFDATTLAIIPFVIDKLPALR